jgi:hypothetical protein
MAREPGANVGPDRSELEAAARCNVSKIGWGAEAYGMSSRGERTANHEHRLDVAARTVYDQ